MAAAAASEANLGPRQDRARFELGSVFFLTPALALMAVLFLGPIVHSLYLTFTNLQLAGPHAVKYGLTGLTKFRRVFPDTPDTCPTKLTVYVLVASALVGPKI